jgi:hypothetical protein
MLLMLTLSMQSGSGEFVIPSSTQPLTGNELTFQGEWKGKSAGGCLNHQTWRFNPQIFLTVNKPSKVTITLSQEGKANLAAIGFYVFKSRDPFKRLVTLPEDPDTAIEGKTSFKAQNKSTFILSYCLLSISFSFRFSHLSTHIFSFFVCLVNMYISESGIVVGSV